MRILQNIILRTALLTILMVLSAGVFGSNEQQPVSFKVKAPTEVLQDEEFLIEYSVILYEYADNMPDPEIGKFTDFDVLAGPSKRVSVARNWFGETEYIQLLVAYRLKPKKAGSCELPIIKYTVNGESYKSAKTQIKVIPNQSNKSSIKEIKDGEAFIRALVSKQRVGTSDTLTVTYRLYSPVPIYKVEKYYNFPLPRNDFYFEDFSNERQGNKKEVYNGKEYYATDIRILLMQPRSEGTKVVKGGTVEMVYTAATGKKSRNRYGDIVDEVVYLSKELKIEDVSIRVIDLVGV